jgi:hypothetical protein
MRFLSYPKSSQKSKTAAAGLFPVAAAVFPQHTNAPRAGRGVRFSQQVF